LIKKINDDKIKLQEYNAKLGELAVKNDLPQRDYLNNLLDESNQKVQDLQYLNRETEKNLELVEKNLSSDNKHLRGKIQFLEHEKQLQNANIEKLNAVIQVIFN
jgi:hypothetical protein